MFLIIRRVRTYRLFNNRECDIRASVIVGFDYSGMISHILSNLSKIRSIFNRLINNIKQNQWKNFETSKIAFERFKSDLILWHFFPVL